MERRCDEVGFFRERGVSVVVVVEIYIAGGVFETDW